MLYLSILLCLINTLEFSKKFFVNAKKNEQTDIELASMTDNDQEEETDTHIEQRGILDRDQRQPFCRWNSPLEILKTLRDSIIICAATIVD